jgi:membrane associated rhomboid family serine protease
MTLSLSSSNQQPLFWFNGHRIYTAPLLVSLYVVTTVVTAILLALGRDDLLQFFVCNNSALAHGELWRVATYSFVNPPSLSLALEIGLLYYFGRLVESGIGSRAFLLFYGGSILLQGLLFQLTPLLGQKGDLHGIQMVNMGLLAAFVTMYPSASFFFGIAARWILLLLLGLSSLQLLAEHQWISMTQLLTLSLAAILFIKSKGYRERLYFFSSKALEKPTNRSISKPITLPPPEQASSDHYFTGSAMIASLPRKSLKKSSASLAPALRQQTKKSSSTIDLDQLLDKISATGLSSLTDREREALEAGRLDLLKRDRTVDLQKK